jgi:hypothetical protein
MYKVFGYDWDGMNFEYEFDSFVKALLYYKQCNSWTVTFMNRGGDSKSCLYIK